MIRRAAACVAFVVVPCLAQPPASAGGRDPWISDDGSVYSWDQLQYGPRPRPRQKSALEIQAAHTSRALDQPVGEIHFDNIPFGMFVSDFLKGEHGLETRVDWAALAAGTAGVHPSSPVTVHMTGGRVEDVLNAVLARLSSPARDPAEALTFYVIDGGVSISTRAAFDKVILTRVYDITDLGMGVPNYMDAPQIGIRDPFAPYPWDPSLYADTVKEAGTELHPQQNFEELRAQLIDNIKEIRPMTWWENGGRGQVLVYGKKLVIHQTAEMHQLIGGKWW